MFKPEFTLTSRIINELSNIERSYGSLTALPLIPSLSLRLTQENQILATHYSTSIEGNPLSERDVTNIILGDKIPVTKSEREVTNYFRVLTMLQGFARDREEISSSLVKKLHKLLMEGLIDKGVGEYRESGVFVGHTTKLEVVVKHNPPFHNAKEIENALQELFDWLGSDNETHPMLKAGILHHRFAYIHPFYDGNGRLARILTTYYLLLNHYEVTKYFILDDFYDIDRSLYSDSLHTADKGESTMWLEYFLEGIGFSLQGALSRIRDLSRENMEQIKGEKRVLVTPREEEVLEIVVIKKAVKTPDIEETLAVTRQQAHALLSSLVKKKLLKKFGKTKTSYYRLAHEKAVS